MYTRIAHAFAGFLIIGSLVLQYLTQNSQWLWITAFVGVNLLQNSITNWCLLHEILKALGVENEKRESCDS